MSKRKREREREAPEACPVCGEVGVKACVDEEGRELNYDHEGRPPYFPPVVDRIFWPKRFNR